MEQLRETYKNEIIPAMMKKFEYKSFSYFSLEN